jgi:hypothetical protein
VPALEGITANAQLPEQRTAHRAATGHRHAHGARRRPRIEYLPADFGYAGHAKTPRDDAMPKVAQAQKKPGEPPGIRVLAIV